MKACTGVVKNISARGRHSVVFYYKYQFRRQYQLFSLVNEKHNEADAINDDIAKVIGRPVFKLERYLLKFLHRNGYC